MGDARTTNPSVLDSVRACGNQAAGRLAAYVFAFPDAQHTRAALAELKPEAAALLDETPRVFLSAAYELSHRGIPPTADAMIRHIGTDEYCRLGLSSFFPLEAPVLPFESVAVVNHLAIAHNRHRAARLIYESIRRNDNTLANEARRLLEETL